MCRGIWRAGDSDCSLLCPLHISGTAVDFSVSGERRSLGVAGQDGGGTRLCVTAELVADHLVSLCLLLFFARKGGVPVTYYSMEKQLRSKADFKRGSRNDLVA